jgi:transposase
MHHRRLVGIDLGITSAHTVRVLSGDGSVVCRRKAAPTVESLAAVEQAALAGSAPATRLEVVVEPTGPAWLPIAVFFTSRGHTVYRVSSAKAHDLRRVLSRHAKANGIDADTLARLPLVDPAGLHPLELPDASRAALDRRVRATDRLTRQAASHKRRIKDLVRQLLPCSPLTGELGRADLAVLERFTTPQALLAAGPARLARLLHTASHGQQGAARAQQWLAAAQAALELYGDHPAVAFADLAAEVHTEVRLLAATQAELDRHAGERERCYRRVDPAGLARSLPGLAEIGGPALVATMAPRAASPAPASSAPSPAWPPRLPRPARPTANPSRSARLATGCSGPPWSAPPTTPAASTPSSPASTTCRWSSAARTTSAPCAWSPPTWPSGPGSSWTAACPTSSATPTAPGHPHPSQGHHRRALDRP